MARRHKSRAEGIGFVAAIAGILIVLNILSASFSLGRADFTGNELFSLSPASVATAEQFTDRVMIKAYFSENLPTQFTTVERTARDLLAEYAAANPNIRVQYIRPDGEEENAEAEADGVQLIAAQDFSNDSMSVTRGYFGLSFQYLDQRRSIPILQGGQGLEYQITMILRELVGQKIKVGVVSGHESPALSGELGPLRGAMPTYELSAVDLANAVPDDIQALIILGPETPYSEAELRNLDAFVMRGGGLAVFAGGTSMPDMNTSTNAAHVDTGLGRLYEKWGVAVRQDMVFDSLCERVPVPGPMGLRVARPYPPIPIVQLPGAEDDAHASITGLTNAIMPFASSIELVGEAPEGVTRTVLTQSSDNSVRNDAAEIDLAPTRDWSRAGGVEMGPFPLAVAVEGTLASAFDEGTKAPESARVAITSSSAVMGLILAQASNMPPRALAQQLAFPLSLIDWVANDEGLIAIRAKNATEPRVDVPQDVLEAANALTDAEATGDAEAAREAEEQGGDALDAWETKKLVYQFGMAIGLPLLVAIFGLVRWFRRRNLKASAA